MKQVAHELPGSQVIITTSAVWIANGFLCLRASKRNRGCGGEVVDGPLRICDSKAALSLLEQR